MHYTLSCPKWR